VQRGAFGWQQVVVDRLLDQRVPEGVRIRARFDRQHVVGDGLAEHLDEIRHRSSRDRREDTIVHPLACHRGDL